MTHQKTKKSGPLLYGKRTVQEFLNSKYPGHAVHQIFLQEGQKGKLISDLQQFCKSAKFNQLSRTAMNEKFSGHHQGLVLEFKHGQYPGQSSGDWKKMLDPEKGPYLCLDRIQDAQNLGAIIRSAEALGVRALFTTGKGVYVNDVVHRISSGASLHLPIFNVSNVNRFCEIASQKGLWICASGAPEDIKDLDKIKNGPLVIKHTDHAQLPKTSSLVILIGNEGDGLGQLVLKRSDFLLTIPLTGKTNSINAGIAAAILIDRIINR